MNRRRTLRACGPIVALLLAGACSKVTPFVELPNQLPTVEITSAPAPGGVIGNYSYDIRWAGRDADGRIDHFLYAVDPPSQAGSDTAWTATALNRRVFVFSADSLPSDSSPVARRFHTVVVKAVDDRAGVSAPAWVSFTASTLLPTLRIQSPQANKLLLASVGPDFHVSWLADDPDGRTSHVPAQIRFRLFGASSSPGVLDIRMNPDTLLKLYAPTFAGWDSLPGSATGADIHGLQPGTTYLLAVVAIDEAGACSAPFTLDTSILGFGVSAAAAVGPALALSSVYFTLGYGAGGFFSSPSQYFHVEVPADLETVVDWTGTPAPGTFITGYRWAVDLSSLSDETPRSDESHDLVHWSQWQLGTQARLPAVHPGFESAHHFLYLEARDNVGALGLVVVAYTAVTASFERSLLIVDDTRFPRDVKLPGGCVQAPRGVWPTASELDTFLFARGGKPWKCYPAGTLSTPGIFAGYAYDSLVTYGLGANLTLAKLAHYRNIVWMVNGDFVLSQDVNLLYPMLRLLSVPGATNPLRTWIGLGGHLWVMGGGIATATQIDYEIGFGAHSTYSSSNGELSPARFMYILPHWRSEITENRTNRATLSARAVGGWAGAPDYSLLPPLLEEKTSDTDVMAPNRTNPSDFYRSNFIGEFLTKPNSITEFDAANVAVSVLDTLYETQGGAAGNGWPLMTLYHGSEAPGLVCSGFPVWYFKRDEGIAVVDWVLQHYWGLTRSPVPR
jgi:hypothetical protein